MIEFTMSRVCMSLCGLVLLASVISPVTAMYGSHAGNMESHIPGDVASIVDSFSCSAMDEITIPMGSILPETSSTIRFDGYVVVLTTGRGTYKAGMNTNVIADDEGVYGYGEIIRLLKNGDSVKAERI